MKVCDSQGHSRKILCSAALARVCFSQCLLSFPSLRPRAKLWHNMNSMSRTTLPLKPYQLLIQPSILQIAGTSLYQSAQVIAVITDPSPNSILISSARSSPMILRYGLRSTQKNRRIRNTSSSNCKAILDSSTILNTPGNSEYHTCCRKYCFNHKYFPPTNAALNAEPISFTHIETFVKEERSSDFLWNPRTMARMLGCVRLVLDEVPQGGSRHGWISIRSKGVVV